MRRSDIHFGVRMMSAMESPEKIEPMVCAMPPIHPEVEKQDGKQQARPGWERHPVENTEVMGGNPSRSPGPEREDRDAGDPGIDQAQEKIAGAVTDTFATSVLEQRKKWRSRFPGQQQEKKGERAGGSEKLQATNLLVHNGILTPSEEEES